MQCAFSVPINVGKRLCRMKTLPTLQIVWKRISMAYSVYDVIFCKKKNMELPLSLKKKKKKERKKEKKKKKKKKKKEKKKKKSVVQATMYSAFVVYHAIF